MPTLTLPVREVRKGDVITAVDGYALPETRTALDGYVTDHTGVPVRNEAGGPAEWWMYEGNHEAVTVEREEPNPRPQRKARRSVVPGVWIVAEGDGRWVSEDGRWSIERDDGNVTECQGPHPVRLTRDMIDSARREPTRLGSDAILSLAGRDARGYLCPGMQEHTYTTWGVWDVERDDYLGSSGNRSFTEALELLAAHLRES